MEASTNTSLTSPDLMEFAAAIAKSLDCMCTEYRDHPNLANWARELMQDAQSIAGDENADCLRSEVWARLRPATRSAL